MMPGRMRSVRPSRARRLRRISSRTGSTRYPETLSSPSVRDVSELFTSRPSHESSGDYTRRPARETTNETGGPVRCSRAVARCAPPLPPHPVGQLGPSRCPPPHSLPPRPPRPPALSRAPPLRPPPTPPPRPAPPPPALPPRSPPAPPALPLSR